MRMALSLSLRFPLSVSDADVDEELNCSEDGDGPRITKRTHGAMAATITEAASYPSAQVFLNDQY